MLSADLIHQILAILTVLGHVILIILLLNFFRPLKLGKYNFSKIVSQNAYLFVFIISLIATLGSLYYSEVAKFTPCELCWYQRIFMYPQTILFLLALYKDQAIIHPYSLGFSAIGGSISLYHYLLQMKVVDISVCPVVGYSVSCGDSFVKEFGYITIPMMALTAFSLMIMFLTTYIKETKN